MLKAGEDIMVGMLDGCPAAEYCRDGAALASVRARVGSTHAATSDRDGFPVHVRFIDFLLLAADLPDGFIPAPGDVIWRGGAPHLVSAIDGEPCWTWHTRQSKRVIRVHSKLISEKHPAAGGKT